jgi:hypothetical protein
VRSVRRTLAAVFAVAAALAAARPSQADGGALVARGRLDDGSPAAVFVAPVPPRVGLVSIEAIAESWRREPPRIRLERDGTVLGGLSAPSPIDPLAAFIEFEVPTEGEWRLVVESDAGRLEAIVPVAGEPPPWRKRLPWMLAWVPAALLLWMRWRWVRPSTDATRATSPTPP